MYLKSILEALHLKMGQWRGKTCEIYTEENALLPRIARLLSDMAELPYQEPLTEEEREELLALYYNDDEVFQDGLACIDCHDIDSEGDGHAPDLTGYGSDEWTVAFIKIQKMRDFMVMKMTACLATVVMKN